MTRAGPVVFLLDVDDTLLDNDRIVDDFREHVKRAIGAEHGEFNLEVQRRACK
ncbi:MAG: hypothetical protein ABR964_14800 [Tepidisphaeraceae bacterium]|jgi:hypothetical protein